jgi:hypothetical protein
MHASMHGCDGACTFLTVEVTKTEKSSTPADTRVSASCDQKAKKLRLAWAPALAINACMVSEGTGGRGGAEGASEVGAGDEDGIGG